FWNVIGAFYLARYNFEIRATNAINRGVFVVSGRALVIRIKIVQDNNFCKAFTNERFFFGLFGLLNPNDDNFITR
ncbi:glycosyltransferase family 2 protein, partial [Cadophora sp. DSE1049]